MPDDEAHGPVGIPAITTDELAREILTTVAGLRAEAAAERYIAYALPKAALLQLRDEELVVSGFLSFARRDPTASERHEHVGRLRAGALSPAQLIWQLYRASDHPRLPLGLKIRLLAAHLRHHLGAPLRRRFGRAPRA